MEQSQIINKLCESEDILIKVMTFLTPIDIVRFTMTSKYLLNFIIKANVKINQSLVVRDFRRFHSYSNIASRSPKQRILMFTNLLSMFPNIEKLKFNCIKKSLDDKFNGQGTKEFKNGERGGGNQRFIENLYDKI